MNFKEPNNKAICSSDEDNLSKTNYGEHSRLLDKTTHKYTTIPHNPSTEIEDIQTEPSDGTSYLIVIIVTIGGFIMGTAVAWTAPAGPKMKEYDFNVTNENISWIAALMPVGALLGCPVVAILVDKLGRKSLMMILTIPTIIGWAMIIWAVSVPWIYVGRIFIGFTSGSFSVIVPLYTTEIAKKENRGTLGTYFQLQVNLGILYTYVMGSFYGIFGLTVACAIIPVMYACLLIFVPESPFFYLLKGNVEKARLSLTYLRGPYGQVDQELSDIQNVIAKTERERIPIVKAFQTTPAKRGLFLGIGTMVFQQFTGCNAIMFYATTIFDATNSKIEPNISTVIIGVMAVVSTYLSTLLIDKLGRKILLLYSIVAMGITTFLIGGFFYAKHFKYDTSFITFLPLVALCTFVIMFSVGFGPIPWMLMGEIFPSQIKGIACSIVCIFNWFFVFLVTKFFTTLILDIYIYNTFWLFTFFSVLGTLFVLFIVPETKGKTLEEIQELLGAEPILPEILPENPEHYDEIKNNIN